MNILYIQINLLVYWFFYSIMILHQYYTVVDSRCTRESNGCRRGIPPLCRGEWRTTTKFRSRSCRARSYSRGRDFGHTVSLITSVIQTVGEFINLLYHRSRTCTSVPKWSLADHLSCKLVCIIKPPWSSFPLPNMYVCMYVCMYNIL